MQALPIGIQTSKSWFDEQAPLRSLRFIRNCGFETIDYNAGALFLDTFGEGNLTSFFDKDEEALYAYYKPLKDALAETGIRVSQFHGLFFIYERENQAKNDYYIRITEKMLAVCAYLDCKYMVVHPWIGTDVTSEEEFGVNLACYRRMIPAAKKYGVTICLENIFTDVHGRSMEGNSGDAELICRCIDTLNKDAGEELFGFCLDVGHANMFGKDLQRFIPKIGNRLKLTHIHDNDGVHDLHRIPYTQRHPNDSPAQLHWERFIRGLRESGYTGALSFETVLGELAVPEPVREAALKLICAIGVYFRDAVCKE